MSEPARLGESHLIFWKFHLDEMKFFIWTCAGGYSLINFYLKCMRCFRVFSISKWLQRLPPKIVEKEHPEMVDNLIESMQSFKAFIAFKNLGFDADKTFNTQRLLFIVMMKLCSAQLRLRIGLRTLVTCHMKARL